MRTFLVVVIILLSGGLYYALEYRLPHELAKMQAHLDNCIGRMAKLSHGRPRLTRQQRESMALIQDRRRKKGEKWTYKRKP